MAEQLTAKDVCANPELYCNCWFMSPEIGTQFYSHPFKLLDEVKCKFVRVDDPDVTRFIVSDRHLMILTKDIK